MKPGFIIQQEGDLSRQVFRISLFFLSRGMQLLGPFLNESEAGFVIKGVVRTVRSHHVEDRQNHGAQAHEGELLLKSAHFA